MKFECTKCGLCCQQLDKVEALRDLDRGDGICIHFCPDIGCAIYNQRPLMCRIEAGYEAYASELMSRQEYYRRNAQICNQLQEEVGMPLKWRVLQ